MLKKALKITGLSIVGIFATVYILFLAVPLFINGIIEAHTSDLVKIIADTTGFKANLNGIKIVTTPKLTAGLKVAHADFKLPDESEFLSADNFEIKLSLLPILAKKIELDKIFINNSKIILGVKKDGHFLLEDAIKSMSENMPKSDNKPSTNTKQEQVGLPFGIKLSNKLPNIYLNNYDIAFVDITNGNKYYLDGDKFYITDFILNKKIKLNANGAIYLEDEKHFAYNINILNNIMPNIELHDLVFPKEQPSTENTQTLEQHQQNTPEPQMINVIDIFKAIHKNHLAANVTADLKTTGTIDDIDYQGFFKVDGMTVSVDGKNLPDGIINVNFKGKKTTFDTTLYSALGKNESTTAYGTIESGKNPKFDMHFLSNAKVNNLIALIDSIAKSFGIKDLDTLTATGQIDANFDIIGDKKSVKSSGYFKLPNASIKYGLYNILIDKINADIDLADNNVNFKDLSFTVLNQPLRAYGTLSSDAVADLHLTADKLLLKALVATAGQMSLLKENDFKSGTLSMDATLKGKLTSPIPALNLSIDDLNIKNIPTDTTITLTNSNVDIKTDGKTFNGNLTANSAAIINPLATIKMPNANITIDDKDIKITDGLITLDNSKINLSGGIYNYMKKMNIDITANGNLVSSDIKNLIPKDMQIFVGEAKGQMPLNAKVTGDIQTQNIDVSLTATPENHFKILDIDLLRGKSTNIKSNMKLANDTLKFSNTGIYTNGTSIASLNGEINNLSKSQNLALNFDIPKLIGMPIPGFSDKTLVTAKGNIEIGGTALNPILKGNVSIPEIKIPEMLVSLEKLDIILNGALAKGSGTLAKVVSGGIVATNLTSDFVFNPETCILYLNKIKGTAFKGNIGGDVSYNMLNGKIGVGFEGSGLDAITAIEGAAGIKNALSGTLGFKVNVTLSGATDVEMIKNLKGNMTFNIDDGALIGIGRIENLVAANNIMSNVILKTAVATLSTIPVIKESANFKYIKGEMTFSNGWAHLTSIKTSGPSMAYFITGKFNILNGTANVSILGRLGSDVIAALGPIGDLSVDKLTSFIPKFGTATSALLKAITTNPKAEKTEEIPQLSSNNEVYKDFKVDFNGGVDSQSAVKSFKWLSNPDTSAIDAPPIKEQLQQNKETLKTDVKETVDTLKQIKEQSKQDIKNEIQNMKDSVNELKNLFKF